MSAPDGVEALIFDVFGTVVDWRSGVAAEVSRLLPGADALGFAESWRAKYQPAMEAVRSGRRGYVALDRLHRETLDATLAEIGADPDETLRVELNRAWEKLPPWPDAAPGLARLKRRVIVAPCSNGSIALMTRLSRFGRLSWDCVLGADVARAYKPDPRAYRGAAAALGLSPERVMMVAAHNDDLAAARACGLRTAFIPRPLERGAGGGAEIAPAQGWEVVAADFEDLAERLGC